LKLDSTKFETLVCTITDSVGSDINHCGSWFRRDYKSVLTAGSDWPSVAVLV